VKCYVSYFRQQFISHLLSAGYFYRLCLLKVHMESCPFPLLQGSDLLDSYFSRLSLLKVHAESSSLPLPLLWCTQSTPPSLLHVLFSSLFIIQFFFVGHGSVCPGGYAGLSQGWQWEYHMLLICSLVGLRLPSRFGASVWQSRSPPVFSV
jgi:hypothetical protein